MWNQKLLTKFKAFILESYNYDEFSNTGEKHLFSISVFVFVWCTFVLYIQAL